MPTLSEQSRAAVENLLQAEEEQLFEQLGIRAKALAEDPTKGSSFEPEVTYNAAAMGVKEDVLKFGKRLFARWNTEAYKLICGSADEDREDRAALLQAFSAGEVAVAAALSALLVTHLGVVPALAAVVAALVVKRFFSPAHEEFCRIWKENLANE